MATVAERVRGSAADRRRPRRPAAAHAVLVAVSVAYCLLVLLRTPQSMSLTFDEAVYASQLSLDTPATEFTAHRSRGLPLLLAPVVMVTESVLLLRIYVTLVSGLLMYVAFRPWLAVFARLGGGLRYVPAVAAGWFATLWMVVLFATMAYPNLWLAFLLVAGVGCFYRAVAEPRPGRAPVVGVLVAFAAAALVRPTDASAVAGPLLLAVLVVGRWRRLWPAVAVLTGLLIGWGAWIGEAFARFEGPAERLRDSAASTSGGLVNSLPANLGGLDGPRLLCDPAATCAGVDPVAAAWWILLPLLVAAGLWVGARTGWFGAGALVTASAMTFAAPYLLLLDYTSPRFLLTAYGLLAIPVAGLLVWLTGLGHGVPKTVVAMVVAGALLWHAVAQQDVLDTVRARMENTYGHHAQLAGYLRGQYGLEPPCLLWGEDSVPLSYLLDCRSHHEPGGGAPEQGDQLITSAVARGDTVLVRVRTGADPPEFMADWRRVELPGSSAYAAYLSPSDP